MTLGRQMAKGAVWMVTARMTDRLIGMMSTIVLVRLLLPADFGLVSMAMSVIAMLEVLGGFSFDVVLIQKQDAERRHYDTAWTFNILVGAASAVVLLLVAAPAAWFFEEPRLRLVVTCLAALPFATGFENVGTVEFRKQLQFDKEFKFIFAKKLASFVVVVPLAVAFRNYWALVIGVITGRLAGVVLSYLLQPYRPRMSLAARHELFDFSKWLMLNNITQFLLQRAPDIIIGKISGPGGLGLFNVSHEIAYMPSNELVAPINRAVFPGYARKSGSLETLRKGFLDVMSVIGLFMIPAAIGMFVTAELLVPVVLGQKWLGAEPLIRLLAIAGLLFAFQTNPTYVYFALGKPRVVSMLTILYVILLQPLMVFATHRAGPLGAAWAYVGTAAVVLPITYGILLRELRMGIGPLFARFWRPVTAAGAMGVAAHALVRHVSRHPSGTGVRLGELLLVVVTGVVVYVVSIAALWRWSGGGEGGEGFVWAWLRPKLASRFR